jgi:hypothetical protein
MICPDVTYPVYPGDLDGFSCALLYSLLSIQEKKFSLCYVFVGSVVRTLFLSDVSPVAMRIPVDKRQISLLLPFSAHIDRRTIHSSLFSYSLPDLEFEVEGNISDKLSRTTGARSRNYLSDGRQSCQVDTLMTVVTGDDVARWGNFINGRKK